MFQILRWFTVSAVALLIACGQTALAQEVGDIVAPARPTTLKLRDDVGATVDAGEELIVEQKLGKWLWVRTSDDKRGWIRDADIDPNDYGAPAPPPEFNERALTLQRGDVQSTRRRVGAAVGRFAQAERELSDWKRKWQDEEGNMMTSDTDPLRHRNVAHSELRDQAKRFKDTPAGRQAAAMLADLFREKESDVPAPSDVEDNARSN